MDNVTRETVPNLTVRIRIETLCRERGKKWSDIYQDKTLQWHKTFASHVLCGRIIPPLWQRIALARVFGVDASVIWDEPVLISAYELKQDTVSTDSEVKHGE